MPVNPYNFRHPRRDAIVVAAAGIGTNILVAAIAAMPLRFGFAGAYTRPLTIMVLLNLLLAFFNLMPVGPLDGAGIVEGLLPVRAARKFADFSRRYGMVLLLIVIIVNPVTDILVWTPVSLLGRLLAGPAWLF